MSLQKNQINSSIKSLCKDCHSFFACEAFDGYCSSCFRKNQIELKNQQKEVAQPKPKMRICRVQFVKEVEGKEEVFDRNPLKEQKDKNKCFTCNKRVGLLGVQCKCSYIYCNGHRLPQNHDCEFNHKEQARKRLQAELIKVDHQKIQEI